jgi:hypothetical protein
MFRYWLKSWRKALVGSCAALLVSAATSQGQEAQDRDAELRALIEQQGKQIQALKQQLDAQKTQPVAAGDAKPLADDAVRNIVADYLKTNPAAAAPAGVHAGYKWGSGFFIKDEVAPSGYAECEDGCKVPFELRFRGRIQLDYYGYKITDTVNHQTNKPAALPTNATRLADFSQLEVKRLRLIWEGTVFDPNLKFNFTLDGNTRGLGGTQQNKVVQNVAGTVTPGNLAASSNAAIIGGAVQVDHAVRMFEAWVSYDLHPFATGDGSYSPTVTLIAGKQKPFFGLEEILGSGNQFMVEYNMADWFFDADDDNLLMAAGTRIKAMDDRLYAVLLITNGSESQFPNVQMDVLPGFNGGFWYDIGGDWDAEKQKWKLFGDYLSDLEYHCNPTFRIGGAFNIVPMDRRTEYGDLEQGRFFVTSPGPGGTRLINVLDGGNAATSLAGKGIHNVDEFDSYSFEAWLAGKWRGLSVWTDWWVRVLNGFHSPIAGNDAILYADTLGNNALFPRRELLDFGGAVGVGYFIVPKKLELCARVSAVVGDSGDLNGTGKFHTVTIPGVAGAVRVYDGAFHQKHEAREYAVGVNYYFHGQLLKWQTDFSVYDGGNPAGGGASPAGFIPGSDGWMIRSQIQLAF